MDKTAGLDSAYDGTRDNEPPAPASLTGLPQEILEQIVVLCDARSVCMLASTCRLARATAGCERVWRLLFDRDFRHMYGPDLDALGRVRVEWPPLALDVVGQQLGRPFDLSVPDPSDDPRVPGPFSRMRAYGKDWRWLYAAHHDEPSLSCRRHYTGPQAMYQCKDITIYGLCQDTQFCPNTTMYSLGDTVNRRRMGYGVKVVRDHQDRVIAWEEGTRQDYFCTGHVLMVGDGQVLCATDKDLFRGTPAFFHDSRTGETTWGVLKGRKWIGQVVRKSAGSHRLRVESGDSSA
ncbi:F-box domain containing protein [Pandoravirus salinus]|uniref:F-box domain containing protein n=1 Tax=Pandoravirus salinus TaxID=1349410 RepID=S4VVE6_9VIRU|nr:F-box domain [Pandoravirus salinus]AGO84338.1 F-box domain containing protein [Pandoravirus salinus]